ncbi:chromatin assembly factor 1 subunit B [Macrobrachium rosenbergii]|uniref:chromatin assembly factor 1 subunit B n=1 Tax=Macrobrachium rosenbergii TaxID=79674 RepID=UPI0034D768B5
MKVTIPEISWHNRDPVLALDVQPKTPDGIYRLATGGTDTHVVIWQLRILDNGGISVEMLSDLTRHSRAVNAVRFSPDGELLATADDEAAIILWKKQESVEGDIFTEDSDKENKELWVIHKMLRGHLEDVYDISWSKCCQYLVSGAVDNTAILWDVSKGKHISILNEHKGFVQGVAWDPASQYIATLCSDRCCRIYSFGTKKLNYKMDKASIPVVDSEGNITEKVTKLFYDDTLKSFCRRLSFSPDGEILLAPSGIVEEDDGKTTNVTYVFSRYNFAKPALYLPTKDKYTVAVRFSPVLYELKPLKKEKSQEEMESEDQDEKVSGSEEWRNYANLLDLPYRMIFAVATQNALFLYDTQQPVPFAKISNMHYTRLSDVAWSSDGRILVLSSTDGYCSLVSFSDEELGVPYKKTEDKSHENHKNVDVEMGSVDSPLDKKKVPSSHGTPASKNNSPKPAPVKKLTVSGKTGKRVSLTTLSSSSLKTSETSQSSTPKEQNVDIQEPSMDVEMKIPDKSTTSPAKTPTGSSKGPHRISLSTFSSPKDKKKSSGKDSPEKVETPITAEVENQSPPKAAKDSLSQAGTQRTPRRIPLTTVSSPKGKATGDDKSPVKATQKTPRRIPLTTVSSPKNDRVAEVKLDEEVTKRFEGDNESPVKSTRNLSPVKTPTSMAKTPRRVSLITLSSPKGKKKLVSDSR